MTRLQTLKPFQAIKRNYGGLPHSIYILFVAQIINRVGGFVYGFLALYMKSKLGFSASQIANFIIINAIFSMFSPFIGGALADKKGRKTIYIVASTLGALMFFICGLITESSPHIVPYLLIVSSVFLNFTGPIVNAMIADIVQDEAQRKRSFALIYLGINLGVAIGPIIGGFLLANYVKWFFIGDAITTLISLSLVALFVKETMLSHDEMLASKGNEQLETGHTFFVFLKRPTLVLYTIFSFAGAFVYAQHSFGMSLHLESMFGSIKGPQFYGLLISFNAIVVSVFTIIVTESLNKLRPIHSLTIASLLYALGFGMLAFANKVLWFYFLSVFIWTIGEIIMMTNSNVFVMANTPVNHRGRFSAIIGLLAGVGYVISPKVISRVIESSGYPSVWILVGIISLVGMLGFFLTGFVETTMQAKRAQEDLINENPSV